MRVNQIWVGPKDGQWQAKRAGMLFPLREFSSQTHARKYGISIAKFYGAEFVLQGRDGIIREKNSYGHDKFPPRG